MYEIHCIVIDGNIIVFDNL